MPPSRHARPVVVGLCSVALILLVLLPFNDDIDLSVPALLLVLPITYASMSGGWRAAVPVALAGSIGYAFGYVPPVGDIRPHVGRDAATMVTFVGVAFAVSGFASRRGRRHEPVRPTTLDDDRVMLLRSVGHDLRNPLQTIRHVTDSLLSGAETSAARSSLAQLASESERLDRIVANMLSASRIQAGALQPDLAPEHVASLIEVTARRLTAMGLATVQVDVPDDVPEVLADAVQFDQVLTNLIENAARHGRSTDVAVSARAGRNVVEIAVHDRGPGLAPEQLVGPVPFRPGASSPGTGLGLVVCAEIVHAHGGELTLANRPGGGATAAFTLRRAD